MDFSNFWWQGTGPSPGGIGKSLRFRGAQYLTGNFSSDVYTFSFWVKKAKNNTGSQYLMSSGGNSGSGVSFYDSTDQLYWYNNAASGTPSPGSYRDPSSWYHVVVNQTDTSATGVKLYINGVQTHTGAGIALSSPSNNFFIGRYFSDLFYWNGYMAEVHAIDGQALAPEVFGYTNDCLLYTSDAADD